MILMLAAFHVLCLVTSSLFNKTTSHLFKRVDERIVSSNSSGKGCRKCKRRVGLLSFFYVVLNL